MDDWRKAEANTVKAEEEARRAAQLACAADTTASQAAAAKGMRWAGRELISEIQNCSDLQVFVVIPVGRLVSVAYVVRCKTGGEWLLPLRVSGAFGRVLFGL